MKKKTKKIYEAKKVLFCSSCGTKTAHMIYDYEKGIYKCLMCGKIHSC